MISDSSKFGFLLGITVMAMIITAFIDGKFEDK